MLINELNISMDLGIFLFFISECNLLPRVKLFDSTQPVNKIVYVVELGCIPFCFILLNASIAVFMSFCFVNPSIIQLYVTISGLISLIFIWLNNSIAFFISSCFENPSIIQLYVTTSGFISFNFICLNISNAFLVSPCFHFLDLYQQLIQRKYCVLLIEFLQ